MQPDYNLFAAVECPFTVRPGDRHDDRRGAARAARVSVLVLAHGHNVVVQIHYLATEPKCRA